MAKTYSVEALNELAALSRLFVKFGGEISEIPNSGSVWFAARIDNGPASGTGCRIDILEPADGLFRDMAVLAGNLERVLNMLIAIALLQVQGPKRLHPAESSR